MQTQPKPPRKQKATDELTKSAYHLALQNNSMMKRLLNNPTLERKRCVKIERLLEYLDPEKWAKLNDAERAEIAKEARIEKENLRLIREARPLMQ